jgi:hypothetical protein
MLLRAIPVLALAVAAIAVPVEDQSTGSSSHISITAVIPPPRTLTTSVSNCSAQTVCADYLNECGQTYGGCFSACKPYPSFTAPPCPSNTSSISITKVTPIPQPPVTNLSGCSAQTVCADYINACGQMYGGCFSACKPWPTFTAPPCSITTSTITSPPTSTAIPVSCTGTVCRDFLETCGTTAVLTYGG